MQKQLAKVDKTGVPRLQALSAVEAIAKHSEISAYVEPFLAELLPGVLNAASDKNCAPVRDAAKSAGEAIANAINVNSITNIIESLRNSVENGKFTEQLLALDIIDILVKKAQVPMSFRVVDLLPVISGAMWVTNNKVKTRAYTSMETLCSLISNKDIERFIPALIESIADPEKKVPETVHLLGATTFVTQVEQPTLALMVPLLERGLTWRDTAIKRKAAVIVDNMCKLVDDPNIVNPFLAKMWPALQANYENIADPEARGKTKQAVDTLARVGHIVDGVIPPSKHDGKLEVVIEKLTTKVLSPKFKAVTEEKFQPILRHISAIAGQLIDQKETDITVWNTNLKPFFTVIVGDAAEDVIRDFFSAASPEPLEAEIAEDADDDGEILCETEFSLAYGAKILLNTTNLRLIRGRRYGLCGPNGAGKSTLMRAINNEQVEGFPKQSEVKTVFVEHDLDASDTEMTTIDWTMMKLELVGIKTSRDEVIKQLTEFGFNETMVSGDIMALSGGWKMKLALCRAVFEKPDILLLDEPTNHLDVKNVAWLEAYLKDTPCTSIIVSHDSGFLNNVCQYIINYEKFKLKTYSGNLIDFVRKNPAAKSYFELGASEMEFSFPAPGFLEGVKTKAKAILKASKMGFKYPGTEKPQISDVNFQCSLGSRIAVIGPNGAGKSTLVNVLCGELIATEGDIWSHENIRIAYIKQHAFAHIDNHLDSTPSEYIQWRFQTGEDRETMDRANKIITDDDEKAAEKIFNIHGTQRRVVNIISRRKFKNSYEYECCFSIGENVGMKGERWTVMMTADNEWLPRSQLLASHQKMVADIDMKEALASGQFRPLVRKEIESHCENFGLDPELVSHSQMRGLSGGQRVKVVLAACSWQRPHLIVLDEPTNYLDRDSLGALSKALKKFEGGVIIISHAKEFTEHLTEEVWAVLDGKMTPSGHNWVQGQGAGERLKGPDGDEEDKFDAMGNKIVSTKKKAKLTSRLVFLFP